MRFGNKIKLRDLEVDFLVMDVSIAYNVTIRRPTLYMIKTVILPCCSKFNMSLMTTVIEPLVKQHRCPRIEPFDYKMKKPRGEPPAVAKALTICAMTIKNQGRSPQNLQMMLKSCHWRMHAQHAWSNIAQPQASVTLATHSDSCFSHHKIWSLEVIRVGLLGRIEFHHPGKHQKKSQSRMLDTSTPLFVEPNLWLSLLGLNPQTLSETSSHEPPLQKDKNLRHKWAEKASLVVFAIDISEVIHGRLLGCYGCPKGASDWLIRAPNWEITPVVLTPDDEEVILLVILYADLIYNLMNRKAYNVGKSHAVYKNAPGQWFLDDDVRIRKHKLIQAATNARETHNQQSESVFTTDKNHNKKKMQTKDRRWESPSSKKTHLSPPRAAKVSFNPTLSSGTFVGAMAAMSAATTLLLAANNSSLWMPSQISNTYH
ncbi:hypothetical protein Cgig2_003202 [Carnegiea gigantea]|uniref:Uncharacterized protein n=1 Tax=Carnegiea gigantea TaxID=171969 RepID=A0A9Q1K464_9CARY|nr:hypothetical protein Cgig2_003202 [Carnegiea gigantea]